MMLHFSTSRRCPRCSSGTQRMSSPWFYRPVRLLLPERSSTRSCPECGWWGYVVLTAIEGARNEDR